MTEVFEHNPGDHEDPEPGPTFMVGAVGVVVLAVTLLGLTALLYRATESELAMKVVDEPVEKLQRLRASQEALLTGPPHWTKRPDATGTGQVDAFVIPIDQAMKIVIDEANKPAKPVKRTTASAGR